MATYAGTSGNNFIHLTDDGLSPPAGYLDAPYLTNGDDIVYSGDGGTDRVYAGGGNDVVNFFSDLDAGDIVDGGSGYDRIVINTGVNVDFSATSLVNVEEVRFAFLPVRAGILTEHSLIFDSANVAAGADFAVDGLLLREGHNLYVDFSAEIDARAVTVRGGGGDDYVRMRPISGFVLDLVDFSRGGSDTLDGGVTQVYFGGSLDATDRIIGQNAYITVYGDYSGGLQLTHAMLGDSYYFDIGRDPNLDVAYPTATPFNYVFKTADDLVTSDRNFYFDSRYAAAGDYVYIDGSAETDGSLQFFDGAADDVFSGGAQYDAFFLRYGGTDQVYGGAGDDFLLVTSISTGDFLNGGIGTDTILFDGDFSGGLLLSGSNINSWERVAIGFAQTALQYVITTDNSFVAPGTTLEVNARFLKASAPLIFDGSAEIDAQFSFIGGAAGDQLTGGAGNDVFDGGLGADTMSGLAGNDFYYVDQAGDVVVEAVGKGTDRVFASSSYTLRAAISVELLTTTNDAGTTAINLVGNELANLIVGNAGANILNGAGGIDTLKGLGGNDQYYVDQAGDVVQEVAGQGNDRVLASATYTLASGISVETLSTTLTSGMDAINLNGNELANTIVGNAGSNILNGRGGIDTLRGFGGNDQYYVDHTGDVVMEVAGEGSDRVLASTGYTLGSGVSVELLTTTDTAGTAAINLFGNQLAQAITGNRGINILQGGGGADALTPGNDTAADTIRFVAVSDSTSITRDTVTGLDLGGEDKLDFTLIPTGTIGFVGGNLSSGTSFNTDIAAAVNAALGPKGAVLFDPTGGTLNTAGHAYLVVDANNDGAYTAGADYLVQLINTTGTLDLTDFV